MSVSVCEIPPELWVVTLNGDRLWNVERVLEHEFEELGGPECGIECVCCGDGLAQHVSDALWFTAFSICLNQMQVLRVLHVVLLSPLKERGGL